LALQTQVTALQATNNSLQASLLAATSHTGDVSLQLERAKERIADLEGELREAEMVRRKLHNTVLELKGNIRYAPGIHIPIYSHLCIRVFCRVRPPLPSDAEEGSGPVVANIAFPDKRDHKEIVLSATGESATGTERKEVWNFGFDRVRT